MKRYLPILAACICAVLAGCVELEPRSFFASDGVTLGTPKKAGEVYRVPLTFSTKIVHSGVWIYDVKSSVKSDQILVTAIFTKPPGQKASVYHDFIEIRDAKPGLYHVRYLDPNGSTHEIGKVTLE